MVEEDDDGCFGLGEDDEFVDGATPVIPETSGRVLEAEESGDVREGPETGRLRAGIEGSRPGVGRVAPIAESPEIAGAIECRP